MPERHGEDRREHHQPEAAEDAGAEAGGLGPHDGGVVGDQLTVEARRRPSIAVLMISASSTMMPKNSENQSSPRKISDPTVRSLLLPVASCWVILRAVVAGDAHQ